METATIAPGPMVHGDPLHSFSQARKPYYKQLPRAELQSGLIAAGTMSTRMLRESRMGMIIFSNPRPPQCLLAFVWAKLFMCLRAWI